MLAAIDLMRRQIEHLTDRELEVAKIEPICPRLMTVPGVRPLTALACQATVDQPARFRRSYNPRRWCSSRPMGIRVNGALMGWMAGEPLRQGFSARAETRGVSVEQLQKELTTTIPLRRIPADDDCVHGVIFFPCALSRAVTCALLDINGGQFMAN